MLTPAERRRIVVFMTNITRIELDDIADNDATEIAIPRTVSADVASRKSYRERRVTARFDEEITKVENPVSNAELMDNLRKTGRAA